MSTNNTSKQPTLYLPVGPSGCGKSTLVKKLQAQNPNIVHYSWDALRHQWYDPNDYANAFALACKDKSFNRKAMEVFFGIIKKGKDVYIDNMNLTPKSRRAFIEAARMFGYKVVAYVFNVDVETLVSRQQTRGDKCVPENVVREQARRLEVPSMSEVDEVHNV